MADKAPQPNRRKVNPQLVIQQLIATNAALQLENATLKAMLNEKEESTNGR